MRPVLELLWYSQQAFHIAIGTAAAKPSAFGQQFTLAGPRRTLRAAHRLSFILSA